MMGGAIGLAILASLAAMYKKHLLVDGVTALDAINQGYQLAFALGAFFALAAAALSFFLTSKQIHAVENA